VVLVSDRRLVCVRGRKPGEMIRECVGYLAAGDSEEMATLQTKSASSIIATRIEVILPLKVLVLPYSLVRAALQCLQGWASGTPISSCCTPSAITRITICMNGVVVPSNMTDDDGKRGGEEEDDVRG